MRRFVTINAPLVTGAAGPLFDQAAAVGLTVFVELVVSALDAAGRAQEQLAVLNGSAARRS